jgi:hypothetical protein
MHVLQERTCISKIAAESPLVNQTDRGIRKAKLGLTLPARVSDDLLGHLLWSIGPENFFYMHFITTV